MSGTSGIVVALTGGAGSGKSTVGRALADRLGGEVASFGDYVRHLANEHPAGADRPVLQQIGQARVDDDPEAFVCDFLTWASPGDAPLVLDGVRHLAIDRTLRRWAATVNRHYILILIEASLEIRADRRSDGDISRIRSIDAHPVEHDISETLPSVAEVIVDGNGTVEEVVGRILAGARQHTLLL